MSGDRPFSGILLMLGFCLLAPLGDGIAKLLGSYMPLLDLIAVRFGMQALILVPFALLSGLSLRLSPRALRLTALRTLLHIAGIGAMFLSLRYLPLADAIAIAYVMPFIALFLGWLVLGEAVGGRRIGAAVVGFTGTLMVVQPSLAAVGWPALLPLVVAVVFALFMLVTRQIAREADPIALQAVSGVMALCILVPAWVVTPGEGIAGLSLGASDWGLLVALGLVGTGAHLLMTWSLRFAPTATVAPVQYLEIVFAALIGWAVFGDFPNGLALAGIAVTVAAGLYVLARERAVSRVPVPPAPRAAPPAVE